MQKLLIVVALLVISAPVAYSQSNAEEAVLKLTRDWLAAEERHDRATLLKIIADDFQGTSPRGNTVFKEDVIPLEGSQSGGLAIQAEGLKARMFGDTSVVTGRGVQKEGEEKRQVRFTLVFAKRGDSWQMVAGHLSAVPQ
jgi:ketosteroid isomerase-like protein